MTQYNDFGLAIPEVNNFEYEIVPAGTYDFVIYGIINMGIREPYKGEGATPGRLPVANLKILFELANCFKEDKSTNVIGLNLPISLHGRSNIFRLVNACFGDVVIDKYDKKGYPIMKAEYLDSVNIKGLLGKVGSLTVIHKPSKASDKTYAVVKPDSIIALDPRLPKPIATKDFILFNPLQPDLDVFRKLTYWTQKDIMAAMNAQAFPTELHDAWVRIEEAKVIGKEQRDVVSAHNTSAIE